LLGGKSWHPTPIPSASETPNLPRKKWERAPLENLLGFFVGAEGAQENVVPPLCPKTSKKKGGENEGVLNFVSFIY
jgi:hypothetical protein